MVMALHRYGLYRCGLCGRGLRGVADLLGARVQLETVEVPV